MYPHRIRLRGPWECQPLSWRGPDSARPLPPPRKMTMPCRLGEGGLKHFDGRVRLVRHFGYPGRIDEFERVWLTFAGVAGNHTVWLNGTCLDSCQECDVTDLLKARNELRVEIEGDQQAGLVGEVALEVRCTAFLRNVRLEWSSTERGELHVRGEVMGTSAGPLELYLIIERRTVAYAAATATPNAWPFDLVATDFDAASFGTDWPVVKLDLVQGASVWYTWEQLASRPTTPETPA